MKYLIQNDFNSTHTVAQMRVVVKWRHGSDRGFSEISEMNCNVRRIENISKGVVLKFLVSNIVLIYCWELQASLLLNL